MRADKAVWPSQPAKILPDVDAACDELRAKGADVVIGPLTRDPGTRLAFIRGPEGVMVELVQRR